MSVPGPRPENRTAGQSTSRRHGEVEVNVTVDELLAAAINVTQNGWPLEALGYDWTRNPNEGMRVMLEQIYEVVLQANRLAVERAVKPTMTPSPAREPD